MLDVRLARVVAESRSGSGPSSLSTPAPPGTSSRTSRPTPTPLLPPPPAVIAPATSTAPAATPSAVLVARGVVAPPKLNLEDAVNTAAFKSKNPATIPVPQPVLDAVGAAKTVLLVAHIAPDGDAVGSTLAMQRGLEKLGVKCDVCIDDDLPGSLRKLDTENRCHRAKDLAGKKWDLALILDVGVPDRIGQANDLLLKDCASVAICDHHIVSPKPSDFKLAPNTPFTTWIEPNFPCASLQAGALLERMNDKLVAAGADLRDVYMPALVGFATDTGFGNFASLNREDFRYFKYMMLDTAKTTMADMQSAMKFDVPVRVKDLLLGTSTPGAAPVPADIRAEVAAQDAADNGMKLELFHKADGTPGIGILGVSDARMQTALKLGRLEDPSLILLDLVNVVKWSRVKDLAAQGADVTAMLIEEGTTVYASTRSDDDRAFKLAQALGGGGHANAAGAAIHGKTLAQARQMTLDWAKANGLAP